ncbi:hypothetical protein [Oerskovia enterophila]|uniref:T surface-antigen of pili n=1 Tax=Oerskovia enterophila TaxID=43678 RepID=A0ABX2Y1T8_9CELL|nr:hypothetical protein [Oerskovia enterophila]OCI30278.1 hypothetical protein OERS_30160 [Oerskovia enterophila]
MSERTARPRGGPEKRRRGEKILAGVTASTLLGTGLIAGLVPTAAAGPGGGINIDLPYTSNQAVLGQAWAPEGTPAGTAVYCIQVTEYNQPGAGGAGTIGATESVEHPTMAFIYANFSGSADQVTQAAISYLTHTTFERDGAYYGGAANAKAQIEANTPQNIKDRAAELVDSATKFGGPYTMTDASTSTDDRRVGAVNNVGVRGASGNTYIPGLDLTVTMTGPAVFDTNGNGFPDAGETNVWTGKSTDGPQSLQWVSTGNGDVRWQQRSTGSLPKTVLLAAAGAGRQDVAFLGPHDPFSIVSPEKTFSVIYDFTPTISSLVPNKFTPRGTALTDTVTVGAQAPDPWITHDSAKTDPVDVTVEGTLYGPFTEPQDASDEVPAGAPVVATRTLTFDGAGTQTVGEDINADDSGYYTWVWTYARANQTTADQQFLRPGNQPGGADFITDGFFTEGEVIVGQMEVELASERDNQFVLPDSAKGTPMLAAQADPWGGLGDSLTVTLPEGQVWLKNELGDPVEFHADGTLYGPFDVPTAPGETPAGAPVVATERLSFTEPGTKHTQAEHQAFAEGFYTWVWTIDKDAQDPEDKDFLKESVSDMFMTELETTSALHTLEHSSLSREYNVHIGGRAFDTVDIDGFPATHTEFEGEGGWIADVDTATVKVYGPFADELVFDSAEVPAGAPVLTEQVIDAVDGTFRIGWGEGNEVIPTKPGYYVFVYEFEGDARVQAFSSPFNDEMERFFVPGTPVTPEVPRTPEEVKVVTQATPEVKVGENFDDTAKVTGDVPEGAELVFRAYGPQESGATPVCTGEPVFTSAEIPVTGEGDYKSGTTKVDSVGKVYWVETLYDESGEVLHEGECGLPNETTNVVDGGGNQAANTTGAKDLAKTGTQAGIVAALALALTAGGIALAVASKRRRAAASAGSDLEA